MSKLRPDYTTPEGAGRLIARIKAHWAEQGFHDIGVKLEAPPIGDAGRIPRVDIRSALVDGRPRAMGRRA